MVSRWVPGELLVFSGNGMLTGSATLGFLWCAIPTAHAPQLAWTVESPCLHRHMLHLKIGDTVM